jgi:hypothetical protein
MKGWRMGFAVLVLLAAAAHAEETCVDPKAPGWQPVFKRGTQSAAIEAATNDENPTTQEKKLRALAECGVAPGTPVKILESATTFATIQVLDGETKGCTGEFLRSSIATCPAASK